MVATRVFRRPHLWHYALLAVVFSILVFCIHDSLVSARYITQYRDTISTSIPGQYANHAVEFTLNTDIPPGGYISIQPEPGEFDIPTSTFSFYNVDFYVGNTLRPATSTADATYDGISITPGTSGEVRLTLNSTTGISSGSLIRVVLGNTTTYASTTFDTGILNPTATGTKRIVIEAGGGTETASANALIAIVDSVTAGPVDTTEDIPPFRFNGAPTGLLSGTVSAVEMSLETDELAECKFGTASGTPYTSIPNTFSLTGQLLHTQRISNLATSTTYTYYIRCEDDEGNMNPDDYEISFTIPDTPTGQPGTGSSTSSTGAGSGTGTGSSGAGSGGSSGGSSGSGSGGSGSGGGGSTGSGSSGAGGGGLETTPAQYRSGDAQVDITGYAFPNSTITILVDGGVADTARANSSGQFSASIEAIARGVYTFGVYAVDAQGTRSTTFSTTFSVVGARTSVLTNINLMPTIRVNPNPVTPGGVVTFSGSSIPNSTIDIETARDRNGGSPKKYQATSNNAGLWTVDVPTTGFETDTWKVRAKSTSATLAVATQFSGYTFYGVGAAVKVGLNSDLNRDGKVNLIDFSILLFHWGTDGGASNPPADINRDGKVTLTDFSIMIFNWTG
jgi:hypothetical protein